MHYKVTFSLFFLFLCKSLMFAQVPAKKFKWKHLGPFEMPISDVDTGQWTAVGQGWIEDILISDDLWFAGSITGGLYCSKNEGKNWVKIDDDSVQMGTLSLLRVGDTIYRGTGVTHYGDRFGFGLYRSTDLGKHWKKTGLTFNPNEKQVLWDVEVSADQSILASCSDGKVYLSTDASKTWFNVLTDEDASFRRILFHKNNPNEIWVTGSKMYHSTDAGNTWENVTSLVTQSLKENERNISRIDIAQDQVNPDRLLVFYGLRNASCILESLDGGLTWKQILRDRNIRRADIHHTEIEIAPDNPKCVIIGAVRCFISFDGGYSFELISKPANFDKQFVHDDIRGISVRSENDIYLATDGGVFRTEDKGKTWENVSGKGLTAMQIYGFTTLRDGSFLFGTQDMGYCQLKDDKWRHLGAFYGDGGDAIDVESGTVILIGGRAKLIDLNGLKKSQTVQPSRNTPFIAEFAAHPYSKDSFYYAGNELWLNTGDEWQNLVKDLPKSKNMISGFDVNATYPNQLFVAYHEPTWGSKNLSNKFYKSLDGGKTWDDLSKNLPILAWRHIESISTAKNNPDEVIVSLGIADQKEIHKVYRSLDGGSTWENYSSGLPPYETFKVEHINNGSTGLIVSTLKGLYYRNVLMEKWIPLVGKIDPIAIRDFEIDTANRVINAATYGRGFWQMKLPKKMLKY